MEYSGKCLKYLDADSTKFLTKSVLLASKTGLCHAQRGSRSSLLILLRVDGQVFQDAYLHNLFVILLIIRRLHFPGEHYSLQNHEFFSASIAKMIYRRNTLNKLLLFELFFCVQKNRHL